jgi:hypothetical protein
MKQSELLVALLVGGGGARHTQRSIGGTRVWRSPLFHAQPDTGK